MVEASPDGVYVEVGSVYMFGYIRFTKNEMVKMEDVPRRVVTVDGRNPSPVTVS